jgi:hypothetical protein
MSDQYPPEVPADVDQFMREWLSTIDEHDIDAASSSDFDPAIEIAAAIDVGWPDGRPPTLEELEADPPAGFEDLISGAWEDALTAGDHDGHGGDDGWGDAAASEGGGNAGDESSLEHPHPGGDHHDDGTTHQLDTDHDSGTWT